VELLLRDTDSKILTYNGGVIALPFFTGETLSPNRIIFSIDRFDDINHLLNNAAHFAGGKIFCNMVSYKVRHLWACVLENVR
jgi:hypothetical protein